MGMTISSSVQFFDSQFQRQVSAGEMELNPFEKAALPYLKGRVLDYGCGLGNLAITAARQGCSVRALDASHTAIAHLQAVASKERLAIEPVEADLREYRLTEDFDTVVSIGLLMFFDCPTAFRQLAQLQLHVRPGGTAVVNVLVQGTTFLDMFEPQGHCLFDRDEMLRRFAGWTILSSEYQDFPAPGSTVKAFATLVAQKPVSAGASA
jgi:tellurite methyltransferase